MSVRQYTNRRLIKAEFGTEMHEISDRHLNLAEQMIDSLCYMGFDPKYRRYFESTVILALNFEKETLDGTDYITVDTGLYQKDNFFQYCNVELLEGDFKGNIYPVLFSKSTKMYLPYHYILDAEAQNLGDSLTLKCKTFQLGLFPRVVDCQEVGGEIYKQIPHEIREAAKVQTHFIQQDSISGNSILSQGFIFASESFSDSYSYSLQSPLDTNSKESVRARMHPDALMLIHPYTLVNFR